MKIPTNITLDENIKKALKMRALKFGSSVSTWINVLLKRELRNELKIVDEESSPEVPEKT